MRQALIVAAFSAAFAAAALAQAAEQGDAGKKSAETAKTASSEPDGATETSGDWSIACSTPAGAAERVYEVNTAVLRRGQAMPFARIAVVRPAKDKPARVIALAPVNVSVGSPVKIGGDSGRLDVSLPFKSCVPAACVAEVELTKEQTQLLAAPAKAPAQLTIVDAAGKRPARCNSRCTVSNRRWTPISSNKTSNAEG